LANKLPDVNFGPPESWLLPKKPMNWRRRTDVQDIIDDDAELEVTPQYVVEMLGFDPKEIT
jgi:hypothetical protein